VQLAQVCLRVDEQHLTLAAYVVVRRRGLSSCSAAHDLEIAAHQVVQPLRPDYRLWPRLRRVNSRSYQRLRAARLVELHARLNELHASPLTEMRPPLRCHVPKLYGAPGAS